MNTIHLLSLPHYFHTVSSHDLLAKMY